MEDSSLNASHHHLTVNGSECPEATVVHPSRDEVRNFPIVFHQLPAAGAKCRVDTSLSITLDLAMVYRDRRRQYSRVGSWRWLRLPEGTYSKGKERRPKAGKAARPTAENTVTLSVSVTRSSNSRRPVSICSACSQREENRTNSPAALVVFGNVELLDFSKGRVVLRPRVTCYSKHHGEADGFLLHFQLRDSGRNIIGSGTTPPILITDERAPSSVGTQRVSKRRRLDPSAVGIEIPDGPSARHRTEPCTPLGRGVARSAGPSSGVPASHALTSYPSSSSSSCGHSSDCQSRPAPGILAPASPKRVHFAPLNMIHYDPVGSSSEVSQCLPTIASITPESGSMTGGTKVTVLSTNFQTTHKVLFGERAAVTKYWSTSALECITPPNSISGPVVVNIEDGDFHDPGRFSEEPLVIPTTHRFHYRDTRRIELSDLMRRVISWRLTGGDQEAKHPLMRLLSNYLVHPDIPLLAPIPMHSDGTDCDVFPAAVGSEDQLIAFLTHLDYESAGETSAADTLSLTSEAGRNLLHLSAALGFDRLVADLIRRGISLNKRDVNGYTALYFAEFYGMDKCARVLATAGASVTHEGPMEHNSERSWDADDRDQAMPTADMGLDDPTFAHSAPIDSDAPCPAFNGVDRAAELSRTKVSAPTSIAIGNHMRGHTGAVDSVAFSPDGTRIVSYSDDKTVRLWGVSSGAAIGDPIRVHSVSVFSVAFSPDATRIALGYEDTTICLWDVSTGAAIGEPMQGHTDWVQSVAFSPDGTRIASGSADETLRLWDALTRAAIGEPMRGHTSFVVSVAFSPDGTHIASGSSDKTIRLWDVSSGAAIGESIQGHTNSVFSVAFSPDGAHIASSSGDQTIRLWNVSTGMAVGVPMQGHISWVNSVAFSPDGKYIVSGSSDKTLRLWDASYAAELSKPTYGYILRVQQIGHEHEWHIDFDDEEEQEEDGAVVHTSTVYLKHWSPFQSSAVGSGSSMLAARDDACRKWLTEHLVECSVHSSSSSS